MYQALYRKWRPQTFSDVIGQKHITDTLRNQVITGHLSHAYIFIGTRGTGKTTCARILAKAVNCENPVNGDPCGKCAACRGIADGSIMDIVELDAASNNGVDNVRALRDEAVFSPASVKKRVYIIDEVHMLSMSAFNALLKILEEPPEHLMFILATTELQKVPATILSRCQRHTFKRIDHAELTAYLEDIAGRENISLTSDAARLLAGLAEGSVRDSLSMLDQCSSIGGPIGVDEVYSAVGLAGNRRTLSLFSSIVKHDTESALTQFDELWKDGKDPAVILKELSNLARDILLLKVAPKSADSLIYGGFDKKTLKQFADIMTTEEISCTVDTLQSAQSSMRDRLNTRMTAELCIISLSNGTLGYSLENIRARLSALENTISSGIPIREVPVQNVASSSETNQPAPVSYAEPAVSQPNAAAAAVQTEQMTEEEENPTPASENRQDIWQHICEEIKPRLPAELKAYLSGIVCKVENNTIILSFENSYYLSRFNRDVFTSAVKDSAFKYTGIEYGLKLEELKVPAAKNNFGASNSLESLKQFSEVKFI